MPSKKIPTELSCRTCHTISIIQCLSNRDYSNWQCRSCAIKNKWTDNEYRLNRPIRKQRHKFKIGSDELKLHLSNKSKNKILTESQKLNASIVAKQLWQSQEYRDKIAETYTGERRKLISERSKQLWQSQEYRDKILCSKHVSNEYRLKQSKISKRLWQNQEYRNKILQSKNTIEHKELMKRIQTDPEYIKKLSIAYNKLPRVSNIQKILYSILDNLGVEYYGESHDYEIRKKCMIGPWSFDCVIPTDNKTLLIECQGDWIHSLPHKCIADKAKFSYINKYFCSTHTIKYLWEHQFASYNCVVELLKHWLGLKQHEQIEYNFSDITINKCSANDYKPFLQAYHYLQNAGRGGISYGAYIKDILIGVCVFSPLSRQNIVIDNYLSHDIKDLSRFCIHPNYQKKNFASWFLSKVISKLDDSVKAIITYADTTFNHNGTIYKASNFVFDGYTECDYWYTSNDGWVMHKKTLYNKAVNLKLTESEYADKFGFKKTYGYNKQRFIFRR